MMRPTSGAARARRAIGLPGRTRSWWRQQKGRQQSAASLLLDLAKFYEHVGHDHHWEEGQRTSFPAPLLACWCASHEGWRFVEADKCATFPFWAFGTILPGCSGATTAAKLMLALSWKQWQHGSRPTGSGMWSTTFRGTLQGTPKMVQVLTAEAARLLVEGLQARRLTALQRAGPTSSLTARTSSSRPFCSSWIVLGIDECDTARNVGADLQLGRRRRALVVKGGWRGQRGARTRQAAAEGRGTHSQSDSHWLECWGALGFRGSGLHSNTAQSHPSRRGQSHISAQPRTERSHNDDGPRPGNGCKETSVGPFDIVDKSCAGLGDRQFGRALPGLDTMRAAMRGSLARLSHLERPWCGATDAVATFVLTLLRLGWSAQSARHLTSHSGTKIDLLAVAPKTVGIWVDQASLLWSDSPAHWNQSKGPLFWEAIRPLLVSGKMDGLVTLASERAGQAGLARHLDPGEACAAQGRGRRQLPAMQRRTRHHAPPLLRVPGPAGRERHVRLTGVAPGGTFAGVSIQGTVCTWHFS